MKVGYCLSDALMGGVQTLFANLMNSMKDMYDIKCCILSMDAADPLILEMIEGIEIIDPKSLEKWADIIHLDGMNRKLQYMRFKNNWGRTLQHVGSPRKVNIFNNHMYSPTLVAVSENVGNTLKQKYRLIYPAVDIEKFRPLKIKKKYDILFMGRLRKIKNPALFLDICREGDYSFLIIGGTARREGGRINEFEERARAQMINGRDNVTGFISYYDVPKYINQARIGIVTSNSEALGFNCIEPMACGVPVISRNVGGTPEAIGKNSPLLVPNNATVDTYIKKINMYIDDPCLPKEVRKMACKKFSYPRMLKEYSDLYSEIYSNPPKKKETLVGSLLKYISSSVQDK